MNSRNLTENELNILHSFESITQINDSKISIDILENYEWDLERAISSIYENQAQRDIETSESHAFNSENINFTHNSSQRSSEILTTNTNRIISLIFILIIFPFSILYKMISKTIHFFAKMFPFLSKFIGLHPSNLTTEQIQKFINPRNTSEKFIREFEKKYGTIHIPFFEGGYTEALISAKNNLMFLMIILQSDLHDETSTFNKITLTNEKLIQFIVNNNILVWAGSVHEPEAFQGIQKNEMTPIYLTSEVSNSLNCTRFPFISISISHLHNSNTSNISSLARIEGFILPGDMIATLETYIAQHFSRIQQLRIAKEKQLIARQIRTQQDNAYEASLAIDRERMLQRKEEERHKAEIEKKKQKKLNNAKILEANRTQWKIWRASKLFPEPASGSPHVAKISLRLQNGERIVRKFDKNASIEEIYAFIECRDINTDKLHKPLEPPSNYIHKFNFQLVSPMPRQIIKQDTKHKILEEKTLFPTGNIIGNFNKS
ncbi:uncharacterized protein T551_00991 [Pneumocystis jirovecii RU7]|uniref:UBX domain-containing protein n=1 Tax=Pneumocystis jirovecii (strain RU7) TaxID=1408657 RepID=A0A0W4ZTL5_PNEJ7|nr:uncharacterized protein T551_00991 [Pneumocystis jirovecii RU7]KTW31730.1 hypothetical protein T551_00991 [Pneumocystis jirovecii RU7]